MNAFKQLLYSIMLLVLIIIVRSEKLPHQRNCDLCSCDLNGRLRICWESEEFKVQISPAQRKLLANNVEKVTAISSLSVILRPTENLSPVTAQKDEEWKFRGDSHLAPTRTPSRPWCSSRLVGACCQENAYRANASLEISNENFSSCWTVTIQNPDEHDSSLFELLGVTMQYLFWVLTGREGQIGEWRALDEGPMANSGSGMSTTSASAKVVSISAHLVIVVLVVTCFIGVTLTGVFFFMCRSHTENIISKSSSDDIGLSEPPAMRLSYYRRATADDYEMEPRKYLAPPTYERAMSAPGASECLIKNEKRKPRVKKVSFADVIISV